jgi:hypothetical protein
MITRIAISQAIIFGYILMLIRRPDRLQFTSFTRVDKNFGRVIKLYLKEDILFKCIECTTSKTDDLTVVNRGMSN